MKTLSFREMSALGSALAIALAAYLYFPHALQIVGLVTPQVSPDAGVPPLAQGAALIGYIIGLVIFLVVLQIIYHIVIGILWRRDAEERRDERDRMVVLKANRLAYYVLLVGLFVLIGLLLVSNVSSLLAAQYVFMALFAGEFARYFATFVYYRLSI
jgi:hypothetical protein